MLRVLPMLVGSGLLVWRIGAGWTWVLLGVAALLAVGVGASASFARAFVRVLVRLEVALVQGVSWILLGIVFVVLFVPGRMVLYLAGDSRFGRRTRDTFWSQPKSRPPSGGFEHPY